jgi:FG-GAP repeat
LHHNGAAYVFDNSGGSWTQQAELVADDGAPGDDFGRAVALADPDTVLVGAPSKNNGDIYSGAVYVFTRSGDAWQQTKFDREAPLVHYFGSSLAATSGNIAAVGADQSAFVFQGNGSSWSQAQRLSPSDPASDFGNSVGIDNDLAVVGAPGGDGAATGSGSAYVFAQDSGSWTQQAKLTASDGATGDQFGVSVGISGFVPVVGAPFHNSQIGAAYAFDLTPAPTELTVSVDIKPGSDTNPVNLTSKGVIPVAILGSADFDVSSIDATTLAFGPGGAAPDDKAGGHVEDVNGDGFDDLLSHYRTQAAALTSDATQACVTGQTLDGTSIHGCDTIRIVP